MTRIYYWPDGTWCYADDIGEYGHMSDDYSQAELSPEMSCDDIDRYVFAATSLL